MNTDITIATIYIDVVNDSYYNFLIYNHLFIIQMVLHLNETIFLVVNIIIVFLNLCTEQLSNSNYYL